MELKSLWFIFISMEGINILKAQYQMAAGARRVVLDFAGTAFSRTTANTRA
jgi:hypothetical protein